MVTWHPALESECPSGKRPCPSSGVTDNAYMLLGNLARVLAPGVVSILPDSPAHPDWLPLCSRPACPLWRALGDAHCTERESEAQSGQSLLRLTQLRGNRARSQSRSGTLTTEFLPLPEWPLT
jgi:hypothetical protein